MMSICLFTEMKWQWATLVMGDRFSTPLGCLMALWLTLADQNPVRPCSCLFQQRFQYHFILTHVKNLIAEKNQPLSLEILSQVFYL